MNLTQTLNTGRKAITALALLMLCLGISFNSSTAHASTAPSLDTDTMEVVNQFLDQVKSPAKLTTSARRGYKLFMVWNAKQTEVLPESELKLVKKYFAYAGPNGQAIYPVTDQRVAKALLVSLCGKFSIKITRTEKKLARTTNWNKLRLNKQLQQAYKLASWMTDPAYWQLEKGRVKASDITDAELLEAFTGAGSSLGNHLGDIRAYIRRPPSVLTGTVLSIGSGKAHKSDPKGDDAMTAALQAQTTGSTAYDKAKAAQGDAQQALTVSQESDRKADLALKTSKEALAAAKAVKCPKACKAPKTTTGEVKVP